MEPNLFQILYTDALHEMDIHLRQPKISHQVVFYTLPLYEMDNLLIHML